MPDSPPKRMTRARAKAAETGLPAKKPTKPPARAAAGRAAAAAAAKPAVAKVPLKRKAAAAAIDVEDEQQQPAIADTAPTEAPKKPRGRAKKTVETAPAKPATEKKNIEKKKSIGKKGAEKKNSVPTANEPVPAPEPEPEPELEPEPEPEPQTEPVEVPAKRPRGRPKRTDASRTETGTASKTALPPAPPPPATATAATTAAAAPRRLTRSSAAPPKRAAPAAPAAIAAARQGTARKRVKFQEQQSEDKENEQLPAEPKPEPKPASVKVKPIRKAAAARLAAGARKAAATVAAAEAAAEAARAEAAVEAAQSPVGRLAVVIETKSSPLQISEANEPDAGPSVEVSSPLSPKKAQQNAPFVDSPIMPMSGSPKKTERLSLIAVDGTENTPLSPEKPSDSALATSIDDNGNAEPVAPKTPVTQVSQSPLKNSAGRTTAQKARQVPDMALPRISEANEVEADDSLPMLPAPASGSTRLPAKASSSPIRNPLLSPPKRFNLAASLAVGAPPGRLASPPSSAFSFSSPLRRPPVKFSSSSSAVLLATDDALRAQDVEAVAQDAVRTANSVQYSPLKSSIMSKMPSSSSKNAPFKSPQRFNLAASLAGSSPNQRSMSPPNKPVFSSPHRPTLEASDHQGDTLVRDAFAEALMTGPAAAGSLPTLEADVEQDDDMEQLEASPIKQLTPSPLDDTISQAVAAAVTSSPMASTPQPNPLLHPTSNLLAQLPFDEQDASLMSMLEEDPIAVARDGELPTEAMVEERDASQTTDEGQDAQPTPRPPLLADLVEPPRPIVTPQLEKSTASLTPAALPAPPVNARTPMNAAFFTLSPTSEAACRAAVLAVADMSDLTEPGFSLCLSATPTNLPGTPAATLPAADVAPTTPTGTAAPEENQVGRCQTPPAVSTPEPPAFFSSPLAPAAERPASPLKKGWLTTSPSACKRRLSRTVSSPSKMLPLTAFFDDAMLMMRDDVDEADEPTSATTSTPADVVVDDIVTAIEGPAPLAAEEIVHNAPEGTEIHDVSMLDIDDANAAVSPAASSHLHITEVVEKDCSGAQPIDASRQLSEALQGRGDDNATPALVESPSPSASSETPGTIVADDYDLSAVDADEEAAETQGSLSPASAATPCVDTVAADFDVAATAASTPYTPSPADQAVAQHVALSHVVTQRRVVHTVCKVPLKDAADDNPALDTLDPANIMSPSERVLAKARRMKQARRQSIAAFPSTSASASTASAALPSDSTLTPDALARPGNIVEPSNTNDAQSLTTAVPDESSVPGTSSSSAAAVLATKKRRASGLWSLTGEVLTPSSKRMRSGNGGSVLSLPQSVPLLSAPPQLFAAQSVASPATVAVATPTPMASMPMTMSATPMTSVAALPLKQQHSMAQLIVASPARPGLNPRLLSGAVVYVDVYTAEGADASGVFVELLQQMGARCVKQWNWNPNSAAAAAASAAATAAAASASSASFGTATAATPAAKPTDSATAVTTTTKSTTTPGHAKIGITHVVFKDGGRRTLEKVRESKGAVRCVGVSWVLDCERENKWLDESHYAVNLSIVPRGGARRRKSMEPRALTNVNVNPPLSSSSAVAAAATASMVATPSLTPLHQYHYNHHYAAELSATSAHTPAFLGMNDSPAFSVSTMATPTPLAPHNHPAAAATAPLGPYHKHHDALAGGSGAASRRPLFGNLNHTIDPLVTPRPHNQQHHNNNANNNGYMNNYFGASAPYPHQPPVMSAAALEALAAAPMPVGHESPPTPSSSFLARIGCGVASSMGSYAGIPPTPDNIYNNAQRVAPWTFTPTPAPILTTSATTTAAGATPAAVTPTPASAGSTVTTTTTTTSSDGEEDDEVEDAEHDGDNNSNLHTPTSPASTSMSPGGTPTFLKPGALQHPRTCPPKHQQPEQREKRERREVREQRRLARREAELEQLREEVRAEHELRERSRQLQRKWQQDVRNRAALGRFGLVTQTELHTAQQTLLEQQREEQEIQRERERQQQEEQEEQERQQLEQQKKKQQQEQQQQLKLQQQQKKQQQQRRQKDDEQSRQQQTPGGGGGQGANTGRKRKDHGDAGNDVEHTQAQAQAQAQGQETVAARTTQRKRTRLMISKTAPTTPAVADATGAAASAMAPPPPPYPDGSPREIIKTIKRGVPFLMAGDGSSRRARERQPRGERSERGEQRSERREQQPLPGAADSAGEQQQQQQQQQQPYQPHPRSRHHQHHHHRGGDEPLHLRLLAARRRTMQWAPKVGSPLGKTVHHAS